MQHCSESFFCSLDCRRVGFAEATEQPLTATLPNSVDSITKLWDVVEKPRAEPSFDYLWNTAAEEGREKLFARDPFVLGGNELPPDLNQYAYEKLYTADAALKVSRLFPSFELAHQRAAR